MAKAAKAFEERRRSSIFQPVSAGKSRDEERPLPYERVHPNQRPAMRLRFSFRNGLIKSYAYSDLRVLTVRDAGHVILDFLSITPVTISIQGRNLKELALLIDNAMVRCIEESDDREVDRPESEPSIVSITIKPYLERSE